MSKRARPDSPPVAVHRAYSFVTLPSPPGSPPYVLPDSPRAPPPPRRTAAPHRWLLRCVCGVSAFRITAGDCALCDRSSTLVYECPACAASRCAGCWVPPPPLALTSDRPRCEACRLGDGLDSLDALARHWTSAEHMRMIVDYAHPIRFCALRCSRFAPSVARWVSRADQRARLTQLRRPVPVMRGVCKACGGVLDTSLERK